MTGVQTCALPISTRQPDILRGVQIFFNQQLRDVSDIFFYLTVWDDAGEPNNIIYQKKNVRPVYEDSLNKFHTYLFDTVMVVGGTFYVGWVQTTNDSLNLGFDMNINSNQNMFYNVSGIWQQSVFNGSWMIRPLFGDTIIPASIHEEALKHELGFNIYPNPATYMLYLDIPFAKMEHRVRIIIYNIYFNTSFFAGFEHRLKHVYRKLYSCRKCDALLSWCSLS